MSATPKRRIGFWGNSMASNFVNLDALIKREDWEAMPSEAISGVHDANQQVTLKTIELEANGLAFQLLKKPEFQRETSSWEPEKVVDLVHSFLEGNLIPSIIIFRNPKSGNLFVIDGAHRLGALIAWVHNDYGDGIISKAFFKGIIPPEQQKAANVTRNLIRDKVGLYAEIKNAGKPATGQ